MVSKYMFLLIAILLITPLYAVDLSGYDGYITPKFGASVYGQYWYKSDLINWYWATPSFENNEGYYDIYEDSETVNFQITLNTTLHGELYLILHYKDSNGIYDYNDYLVHSGGAGDYSSVRFSENVILPDDMYGEIYYQWVLSTGYWFGSSSAKFSKQYTFFTKRSLNTDWKQKRLISVSSTEKMEDGITQINLNKNITDELYILYSPDSDATGNLNSYSGTLTNLVFTNDDYTKAYPYFINEFKGGYFEHGRTTKNNTVIDLWINENATVKDLYMFYDFKYLVTPLFGWFDEYTLDKPNNPFTVHQVFNDLRWLENQTGDIFLKDVGISYNRGNYFGCSATAKKVYNKFYNYLNDIAFKYTQNCGTAGIGSAECSKIKINEKDFTILYDYYNLGNAYLYNSTGGVNSTGGSQTVIAGINLNSGITKLNYNSNPNYLSISENKTKFNFTSIEMSYGWGYHIDRSNYLYYYQELPNNTIIYSISNATVTDYAYINFKDLLEYDTYINDLQVGGYIEIDNSGLFLCQDSENNILGSVNIVKDVTVETLNIVFPYIITNQSKFLSLSEFNYSCSFISVVGGFEIESENLTINFTGNKIFLDTIKPIHQNNYSSKYINYNINSELNYTGLQTDFYLETSKIKCLKVTNGQCIDYDLLNQYNIYNISNISANYNFNNIYQFDVNNWYMQHYRFYRNGKYSSTATRFFYVYKDVSENLNIDYVNFIAWNNSEITSDTAFMDSKFWENPLNYIGSLIYFMATKDTNLDLMQSNFLGWILFITLNFYTLLAICFIISYVKYECHYISFIITSVLIALFTYMNWTPFLFHYLLILVIGIIAYSQTKK